MPFLILGGTALGTGRGEAVSPVLARANAWHWVVAFADGGLSTPDVYRELDRLRARRPAPAPLAAATGCCRAAAAGPGGAGAALGNDLQAAAISLRPALAVTLRAGQDAGALAGLVSGSGPTCVFLAADAAHADRARVHS